MQRQVTFAKNYFTFLTTDDERTILKQFIALPNLKSQCKGNL